MFLASFIIITRLKLNNHLKYFSLNNNNIKNTINKALFQTF